MVVNDKEALEMIIADKGQRYLVTIDNDSVLVTEKDTGKWVYSFNSYGQELLICLFSLLGVNSIAV